MYTNACEWYFANALFKEGDFFLVPHMKSPCKWDDETKPRIFHKCSAMTESPGGADIGIVYYHSDAKTITCERCKQTPGDDITTIHVLLRDS